MKTPVQRKRARWWGTRTPGTAKLAGPSELNASHRCWDARCSHGVPHTAFPQLVGRAAIIRRSVADLARARLIIIRCCAGMALICWRSYRMGPCWRTRPTTWQQSSTTARAASRAAWGRTPPGEAQPAAACGAASACRPHACATAEHRVCDRAGAAAPAERAHTFTRARARARHTRRVTAVAAAAASPGLPTLVICGCEDGAARAWDAASGSCVASGRRHHKQELTAATSLGRCALRGAPRHARARSRRFGKAPRPRRSVGRPHSSLY